MSSIHYVMPAPSPSQQILEELPGYRHKPTEAISNFCQHLSGWEKLHYAWIIPVNTLVNLINIILAPLAALYHLVAAAMYGITSLAANRESSAMYPPENIHPLYSDHDVYISRAKTHAILAPFDLFESIIGGMAHIFNPANKTPITGRLASDEFAVEDL
jgi:hypothetical protein